MPVTPSGVLFPLDLADPMQDARNMPPPYHYPGRRDPEQEAEDKRRTRTSNRDAMEGAARAERAAFLAHIRGTPGELSVRNMMPSWDTYKNSPEMSGNTAMTDYISRYNAKNPQRAFRPEVYTPQARPAAPAVAPAAPQSRVMQNAPAVGVQAGAPLAPQSETAAEMEKRTSGGMEDALNAQGAVQDIAKKNLTPDQMNERASAVQQSASGAQQPGPLDTLRSAPRPPGIRDDGEVAIQKFLRDEVRNMKPDNRPGAKVGWADDGRNGQKLVSVPGGERSGMAHLDALGEFQRKQQQDRADAYAGTLQRGQTASPEGFAAWSKANPVNYDMQSRAAQAHADAATAPRAVTSRAPVDYTGGAPAFARLEGSTPPATVPTASVTMPNGKVERTAFSATPTTDAVTNAGLGLDALMPGAGLAMTAGAMGVGATNTRGGSMIAQAVKPPGSDTADPNSVASQAKAATSSVANTPMPITSAVKQAATGAATLPMGYEAGRSAFGALKTGAGLIEGGIKNTSDAIGGTVKAATNVVRGFAGASPLDSLSGPPITSTETRQPGPLWNPPPDTTPPAVSDDEMAKWRASVGAPDPKEGKGNPYDKRKRNGAYASLAP